MRVHGLLILFFLGVISCGSETSQPKGEAPSLGTEVEEQFKRSGKKHGIPARFLLATSYLETQISDKPLVGEARGTSFNLRSGHSIFGLPLRRLGLEGESMEGFEEQVSAYAIVLKNQIQGLGLPMKPVSSEDKFQWIWEIAKLHRDDPLLQIIFARELIALLNKGFIWNHPENRGFFNFPKEAMAIDYNDLSHESLYYLDMKLLSSEVRSAARVSRPMIGHYEGSQSPIEGIEVIHCPLTLSSCLQMQSHLSRNEGVEFHSHYMIPAQQEVVDFPLQLQLHSSRLPLSQGGSTSTVSKKIIIMLTGNSGHIMGNKRTHLQGDWYSQWQLEKMSEVMRDICHLKVVHSSAGTPLSLSECLSLEEGVHFHHSQEGPFTLGDIPDFDEEIFSSYLRLPRAPVSYAQIELGRGKSIYASGEEIDLSLRLSSKTTYYKVEELTMCSGGAFKWLVTNSDDIHDQSHVHIKKKIIWDLGPNHDGSHFFRLKTYGASGEVLGWDSIRVYNESPNSTYGQTRQLKKCS